MAAITTASSFLPTIKCSQCSVEIPISHMGDHICSQGAPIKSELDTPDACSTFAAPPLPEPRSRVLDGPSAPSTRAPKGPAPSSLRSVKTPPVRSNTIDTSVSVRSTSGSVLKNAVPADEMPPPPRVPFSSDSSSSSSGRASPVSSLSGRKSPHKKLMRSATAPLSTRPPSPDEMPLPQDSAFPIFPTAKSRSTTPTTPHKTSFGFQPETKEATGTPDVHPPSSPRRNGGENVLERMNSLASGPFNSKGMEVRRPMGADDASLASSGHEFARSASTSTTRSPVRAPSTSSSNYTRNPSISSIAGYTRLNLDESDVPAVPTVPSVALDYDNPRTQHKEEPTNRYTADASPFDFGSFGQPTRAHTFPEDGQSQGVPRRPSEPTQGSSNEEQQAVPRRPSDPAIQTHKSKPSVMLPLYEIGSASSFRPSKSLRGRRTGSSAVGQPNMDSSKKSNMRDDDRLGDAPPVPLPSNSQLEDSTNPYHTPHESVSSNESYGSGMKSSSSRSSPPLNSPLNNNSPQRSKGQLGNDRFNNEFQGFQFGVESQSQPEQSTSYVNILPQSSAPSQYMPPLESQEPSIPILSNPPQPVRPMRTVPAPLRDIPTRQNVSPMTSPEDYLASPASPFTDHARNIRMSPGIPPPPPIPESPARKRTPTSKGQCRGCNEAIYGKSISSADGQLTGRYHKKCFVCKTCNAPFQTTDFYVHHNNPYCARHYHEQNGSLCTTCDRGIEGQYLETDQRQKFHSYCFTCQECHRILRDDFFEWNGRILCEQHAFGDAQRTAQQPSSLLGPGRRYPERRTTKLMMM